ncbi:aspartate kinase [Estrella lausannensis]|nr:aspartate kinase [Estrella lausannensis]
MEKVLVMKFGGASVAAPESFERVAEIIMERRTQYHNIAVVVSAMGDTTDELISLARKVNPNPPKREMDMLITVGERISIALLAMALAKNGVVAKSFTGSQSGIVTSHEHTGAKIVNVKPHRLHKTFADGHLAIVAGFQGVSTEGEITTLGRGGSDTTAVALAAAIGAPSVEFYKDVAGIFDADPKRHSQAVKFSSMTYEDAYKLVSRGAEVLHPRCIKLAEKNGVILQVKSFINGDDPGTVIQGDNRGVPAVPVYELEEEALLAGR